MWDSSGHENPDKFDGYRFVRMRDSTDSKTVNQAYLVSTNHNHLAFGHGKYACAGRFFAAHEAKMALGKLLLRYDWRLAPGSRGVKPIGFGLTLIADPMAKVLIRRRKD